MRMLQEKRREQEQKMKQLGAVTSAQKEEILRQFEEETRKLDQQMRESKEQAQRRLQEQLSHRRERKRQKKIEKIDAEQVEAHRLAEGEQQARLAQEQAQESAKLKATMERTRSMEVDELQQVPEGVMFWWSFLLSLSRCGCQVKRRLCL